MKTKFKKRIMISLGFLVFLLSGIYLYTYFSLPESYYILNGTKTIITNKYIPAKGEIPKDISTDEENSVQISLFGIPVKNVNVSVIDTREVVVCGVPFGIKMYTNGIMVVSMSDVDSETGSINPAYEVGIRVKDIITKVDSKKIYSVEQLSEIIEKSDGKALSFTILREEKEMVYTVTPVKSKSADKYRLGLWVRDSSAGIGTMTYYDKETGMFAGLGHGISDVDTGQTLPLSFGTVLKSSIVDIVKGQKGNPGELKGILYDNMEMGKLYDNSDNGVFGILTKEGMKLVGGKSYEVVSSSKIKKGPAKILCTLDDNEAREYDIEIQSVDKNPHFGKKNMIIKITDPELISKTGGIVQGMSGSPIIQDGNLIGAVTHVFINDPQRGYGIFIENMLSEGEKQLKKAS